VTQLGCVGCFPHQVKFVMNRLIVVFDDFHREAANAAQLRHNFLDSDLIYVPQVHWEHCRRDVMVMEQIDGIPIRDVDAIKKAGVDMKQLAHNGVEIFFTQAFRDGFFHADMHPGNIFVGPDGQYRAVDFGIMGTLSELDKRYLAENLLGFFNRDYRAVAQAHLRAVGYPRIPELMNLSQRFVPSVNRSLPNRSAKYRLVD
jgi:ubiquinone biosynthesis protein